MASEVYFTNFRTKNGISYTEKLKKLIRRAGIGKIDFEGKFVAIKMHFGEMGNLAFLRPNYVRAVVEVIQELGGKPFLTDCNTLYPGSRKNALEHLYTAAINGFNWVTVGCPVLIADGLKGTDDVEVPVKNGELVKFAKIGRAVMDADIVISLSHFKGHEMTGFGGAIKNLGMGCGSRAGKMDQHCNGKPVVDQEQCRGCHQCIKECANNGISYTPEGWAQIDHDHCVGCGRCIGACNFDAIYAENDSALEDLDRKMAEYTMAVCQDRPNFHISLAMDISPNCDCHGENDAAILPNIGMFASFDPVAIDQACADACMAATPMPNSQLSDNMCKCGFHDYGDVFKNSNPNVEWKEQLAHGEKIGLGSREYQLIEVK